MSPIQLIRDKYRDHPQEESFDYYLNWHLDHGFVYSTPDYFIMGRPHQRMQEEKDNQQLIDSFHVFSLDEADCWYVHAMAGNMALAWRILPQELPWMGWERIRNGARELTFVRLSDLHRLSVPIN